ncbi:MAG: FAD-binding protein [Chloroflexi bacterium]|nr:FAD-binding protein [Chloroflexota bacterium]
MNRETLIQRLRAAIGPEGVFSEPADLLTYEYDMGFDSHPPDLVVLPTTTEQVQAAVRLANEAGMPITARGAGTGLCGGAIPLRGGLVVSLTRMNQVLELDYRNRRAVVEPGVINLELSERTMPRGWYYAPDPSSQKISSIGGNVATNAGGPHCLAYGITTNHVLGLEVVLPDGAVIRTGAMNGSASGYDLTGLLVGSEGTLGIVTKVMVRLTRVAEAVRTALAPFPTIDDASNAVSSVIGHGIVPAALEMIDGPFCRAIEAAYHVGLPVDAGAVLLAEIDGSEAGLDDTVQLIARLCREHGARDVRLAASSEERAALWAARKGAAGAIGRMSPNYYIQDGVVPRTKLPRAMRRVDEVSKEFEIQIANVFHAGDGNLHPTMLFDRRYPEQIERALLAGNEILKTCVALGGAISGEHGIGIEKREQMTYAFSTPDLAAMAGLRATFDPRALFNPDKLLPAGSQCVEITDLRKETVPSQPKDWF